ncbi:MAG: MFS transporter [Heyndrickxia sp.]
MLIIISLAKSFFSPASTTYIAKLIPTDQRKRFNSINSLVRSGGFIVGPSIAGVLLLFSSVDIAIYINAISFLFSALILLIMPNLDEELSASNSKKAWNFKSLLSDWHDVIAEYKKQVFVFLVYSLYLFTIIFTFAMDSQEVVFTQKIIGLSETQFSLLVSITGIGYLLGSLFVSFMSQHISIKQLIGIGISLMSVGYIIYSFSHNFTTTVIGFILLGFFNAFSGTGFTTFYQNNIPIDMMGRISSILGVWQNAAQVLFLLFIGFLGDMFSLRYTIVCLSILNFMVAIIINILIFKPEKHLYFIEPSSEKTSL